VYVVKKYDLRDPVDVGQFAKLIRGALGPDAQFVFAFSIDGETQDCFGALSNLEPESAASMMARGGVEFMKGDNYIQMNMRDN
jgi:hypothetical protein